MTLAEKLYNLRSRSGLSQEELAEKLNVSRQSVSKWESGNSIPAIDKIVELSSIYGISTDYLLKDDMEETLEEIVPDFDHNNTEREVSLETAKEFISMAKESAKGIALGVLLCIISPAAMIAFVGLGEAGVIGWSEDLAGGIGLAVLLIIVAIAVMVFIMNGMKWKPYEFLEKESFRLSYGVQSEVEHDAKIFEPRFYRNVALGVAIIIVGVIPTLIAGAIDAPDFIAEYCVAALLLIVACGVYMIVLVGVQKGAYDRLLQVGDYSKERKKKNKKLETFSSVYWCLTTALYLGISFLYNNWEISWIIWPVGGVLFAALYSVAAAMIKTDTE